MCGEPREPLAVSIVDTYVEHAFLHRGAIIDAPGRVRTSSLRDALYTQSLSLQPRSSSRDPALVNHAKIVVLLREIAELDVKRADLLRDLAAAFIEEPAPPVKRRRVAPVDNDPELVIDEATKKKARLAMRRAGMR